MLTLKLCADSATSRRSVDPATLSFAKLSALAAESFPGREVAHYTFQDDEGDTVTILGDADLREAIRIAPTLKPPTLRLRLHFKASPAGVPCPSRRATAPRDGTPEERLVQQLEVLAGGKLDPVGGGVSDDPEDIPPLAAPKTAPSATSHAAKRSAPRAATTSGPASATLHRVLGLGMLLLVALAVTHCPTSSKWQQRQPASAAVAQNPALPAAPQAVGFGYGSRGHEVAALQRALVALGHFPRRSYRAWDVGLFGPKTTKALWAFQAAHGLATDRRATYTAATQAALRAALRGLGGGRGGNDNGARSCRDDGHLAQQQATVTQQRKQLAAQQQQRRQLAAQQQRQQRAHQKAVREQRARAQAAVQEKARQKAIAQKAARAKAAAEQAARQRAAEQAARDRAAAEQAVRVKAAREKAAAEKAAAEKAALERAAAAARKQAAREKAAREKAAAEKAAAEKAAYEQEAARWQQVAAQATAKAAAARTAAAEALKAAAAAGPTADRLAQMEEEAMREAIAEHRGHRERVGVRPEWEAINQRRRR